jgi:3-beta hydroxysteroid dehydrogenase/isomerase family
VASTTSRCLTSAAARTRGSPTSRATYATLSKSWQRAPVRTARPLLAHLSPVAPHLVLMAWPTPLSKHLKPFLGGMTSDVTTARGVQRSTDGLSRVLLDNGCAAGMEVVFHCATAAPSAANAVGNEALMLGVNVRGTENVVAACVAAHVPKLVYTSSASVVFEGRDLLDVDERMPYAAKAMDYYTETKVGRWRGWRCGGIGTQRSSGCCGKEAAGREVETQQCVGRERHRFCHPQRLSACVPLVVLLASPAQSVDAPAPFVSPRARRPEGVRTQPRCGIRRGLATAGLAAALVARCIGAP